MAYGTESIPRVDMVVGPGNQYVAEAKRQIFGAVGIDLLAGPTEIVVIADETADPVVVACRPAGAGRARADVPRDPGHALARARPEAVLRECERQLPLLGTQEVRAGAWEDNGEVILVGSDEEAARVADEYAPEHLEVQTRNDDWYLGRLRNYGSLFVGEESTVAYSDKSHGTQSHPAHRPRRALHGRAVGGQVHQDGHLPAPQRAPRARAWRRSSPGSARSRACWPTRRRRTCASAATGRRPGPSPSTR